VTVLDHRAHKQLVGSKLLCGCSRICTTFPGSTHKLSPGRLLSSQMNAPIIQARVLVLLSLVGWATVELVCSGHCLRKPSLWYGHYCWSQSLQKYLLKTITCHIMAKSTDPMGDHYRQIRRIIIESVDSICRDSVDT